MFTVAKLFELLTVNKKLSASKPHVLSALSSLAGIVFLGMFGTFFVAILGSAALWVLFTQMLSSNYSLLAAALTTLAVALVALALVAWLASHLWSRMRGDIDSILNAQTPVIAPVVDGAAGIAGSFLKGLRTRKGA